MLIAFRRDYECECRCGFSSARANLGPCQGLGKASFGNKNIGGFVMFNGVHFGHHSCIPCIKIPHDSAFATSIQAAPMDSADGESHEDMIKRLTAGFGALLEQVQELARRNQELESRLTSVRDEVSTSHSYIAL